MLGRILMIPRDRVRELGQEEVTVNGASLHTNILHKFASYNTLFTLSGLREEELRDHSFLYNTVHDVVARSGGIGGPDGANVTKFRTRRNQQPQERANEDKQYNDFYADAAEVLKRGRDIFFEEVNMVSTVGPSEELSLIHI